MEILEAKGKTGQLRVEGNLIHITRKGFMAFTLHGFDGTKTLFISKLSGVQFKECGKMTAGFIQFVVEGSSESKKGLKDATNDENSVTFDADQQENFEKIRDYIFSKVQA
mgnify:CR=1 FL=1